MCKDSLDTIPTRLATEGQKLVTHTFPDGAAGFISSMDCFSRRRRFLHIFRRPEPVSAIYVPFGTRLILKNIPAPIQEKYRVQPEEGAIFVLMHRTFDSCRDGLRFANGREIHLRELPAGMPLEVLSLAGTEFAFCEQDIEMHA